ncbi:redox-regulated ATPase YchF [Candidatus Nesciobacter abundans]|uniref:Ribosome-binding ATPase YchF n=1 Tax=Candidatus Nesciobacter abundans TaxID=2601668 RepID=A0A5C0UH75_9PROT|nr:redox-regulated ATPase YchF [Candidatus Nesciobacter abundans]QEK39031.1 redox-regulated ATPase YchF [Candidatus Nesciobacter abundans]
MSLSCGFVGLPNVGKSTIFNVIMKKVVAESSNYPFCTIEPNKGSVPIKDDRLNNLSKIENSAKVIFPTLECVDIAGLVKGASKGDGLGNKFLSHIRQIDLIVHVVRCFDSEEIIHVHGKVDPVFDVDLINTELVFADIEVLEKWIKKNKALKTKEIDWAKSYLKHINENKSLDQFKEDNKDKNTEEIMSWLKSIGILSVLPRFYVANMSEDEIKNGNKYFEELKAAYPNEVVIPIAAKLEEELMSMPDDDYREMLREFGVKKIGLDFVLSTAYKFLGLESFFTVGPKEARGWTIKKGYKAPEAAGVIHTDFRDGFICAEVISYEEFISCEGYVPAKEKGKIRKEGKDYVVSDGDVCNFRFNVLKKPK